MRSLLRPSPGFELIDSNTVNASWNGSPYVLLVNQNVVMAQTANGSMIFGWINQATQNNHGELSLTSGGSLPSFLDAPALSAQPGILIRNWQANNLSVTNISPAANTPIWISAFGPGVPRQYSTPLKPDGTPTPLTTGQSAQGNALPQWMQLVMQSNSPTLGIIAIIGGLPDASGNNGYVVAVNAVSNTGPGTGIAPPEGYYATTTSNSYAFQFNWGSSNVYVVNMSPATASSAVVLLRPL